MGQANLNPRSRQYRGTAPETPQDGPRAWKTGDRTLDTLGDPNARLVPTTRQFAGKDKQGRPVYRHLKPGSRVSLSDRDYVITPTGAVRRFPKETQ